MSFSDDFSIVDNDDEILQPARQAEPEAGTGTYLARTVCGNCGQGGPVTVAVGTPLSTLRCGHCGVTGQLRAA